MPTILTLSGGFRVGIYPNDHRPDHVHVIGKGCEAVFDLNCPGGPPTLRESHRFGRHELTRIRSELRDVLPTLCTAWRSIHGKP